MAELFAMDIQHDLITGVVLDSGSKVSRVKRFVTRNVNGNLQDALGSVVDALRVQGQSCNICIGNGDFSFRKLLFPFADRKKIEQILSGELVEQCALEPGNLHPAFLDIGTDEEGHEVLVGLTPRDDFQKLLLMIQECGINPSVITISSCAIAEQIIHSTATSSFILLDLCGDSPTLIVVDNKNIITIRTLFSVKTSDGLTSKSVVQLIQQTVLAHQLTYLLEPDATCYVCGLEEKDESFLNELKKELSINVTTFSSSHIPLLKIEQQSEEVWESSKMNGALSLALCSRRPKRLLNFRTGDFRKNVSFNLAKKITKATLIPLGIMLAVVTFIAWQTHHSLNQKKEILKEQIVAEFKQALPDSTRIVNPLQQLKVAVDKEKETYQKGGVEGYVNKVEILAELSRRINDKLPITIVRLYIEKNTVKMKGETQSFKIVDSIKKELEKSQYFQNVEISSANLEPQSQMVRFEVNVELR